MKIKQVAVIGASSSVCSKELYEFGVQLGEMLGDLNMTVLNAVVMERWKPYSKVFTNPKIIDTA